MKKSVLLTLIASLLLSGSAMATTVTQRSISLTVNVPSRGQSGQPNEQASAPVIGPVTITKSSYKNGQWTYSPQPLSGIVFDSSNLIYDETEGGFVATAFYCIDVKVDNYGNGGWLLTVRGNGLGDMAKYMNVIIKTVDRSTGRDKRDLLDATFAGAFRDNGYMWPNILIPDGQIHIYCGPKPKDLVVGQANAIPANFEGRNFTGTINVSLVAR